MFQCQFGAVCGEEWFHEECIIGVRPGVMNRRKPTKDMTQGENKLGTLSEPGLDASADNVAKENHNVDESSDDEDEVLPLPGFPKLETFETIICWKCTEKFRKEFECLCDALGYDKVYNIRADTLEARDALLKRDDDKKRLSEENYPFTIFLKDTFKKDIAKLLKDKSEDKNYQGLIKLMKSHSFMFESDPIYQPPDDPESDDNSSIFELGMKSLNRMPVESALGGIEAYEQIKNKLTEFFKPFAQENRVVTKEEVVEFFEKEKENAASRNQS
ncbi:unnamed protein product [Ambrosiozyma monospora]|uniref:Unnamed protein product n=1 Tax=Ambrosiozyma monospora TaxID=43982 RepID=A0ACB5TKF4_AMBMO|nr:unnamed protein product [Ambrosiozyma monospora]